MTGKAPQRGERWIPGALDRYILLELMGPFLFGVCAFTAIMTASSVLFQLIALMVHFGLSPAVVAQVLALRLPEMVFYTFPMSMLLASLLAFGRFSQDSETVAFRAIGMSLPRIVAPVLVVAFLVSAATVALNEFVVPQTKWEAKNVLYMAQNQHRMPVARDNIFYDEMEDGHLVRFFYARHFDGETMANVLVQEFEGDRLARIIQANGATWRDGAWDFHDGVLYQVDGKGEYRYVLRFASQRVRLKESLLSLSTENREPMEMNLRELGNHIRRLRESGHAGNMVDDLSVQWHQKLSIPFASLVFAIVGAPLGFRSHRSSGSLGLGLSILIIFIYYIAMFVFMALGQSAYLPAVAAAWMPNLLGIGIGAFLLWRAAKA